MDDERIVFYLRSIEDQLKDIRQSSFALVNERDSYGPVSFSVLGELSNIRKLAYKLVSPAGSLSTVAWLATLALIAHVLHHW